MYRKQGMIELPSKRTSRTATDIYMIVLSVSMLIFFNFFRDYIAFYHDGVREPLITPEFVKWLWIRNPTLGFVLITHSISLAFKNYKFRDRVLIFLVILEVASTAILLTLFPFDFSILPSGDVAKWSELGLKLALILTIVVYSTVGLVRIFKSIQR